MDIADAKRQQPRESATTESRRVQSDGRPISRRQETLPTALLKGSAVREGILALVVILSVIVTRYWRVIFLGYSLVPADVVLWAPPWEELRPPDLPPLSSHGDLHDLVTQVFPWRFLAAQQIQAHVLPLWNPLYLSGSPLLANAQSAVLYPLNLLYYFLPTAVAFSYAALLRFSLTAAFTYACMRQLGVRWTGSILSAIAFSFCGYLTFLQGWSHSDTAVWLPLSMLAVLLLSRAARLSRVALLAGVSALYAIAGHPETAVVVALTSTAFAAFLAVTDVLKHRGRRAARAFVLAIVASLALGLALSAVQSLPTLEWLPQTTRVAEPVRTRLPPEYLATFLVSDMSPLPPPFAIGVSRGIAYGGALTLFAAVLSLRWLLADRRIQFFAALTVASGLLTFAPGSLYGLLDSLQLTSAFRNYYFILPSLFGLALLAGLVVDHRGEEGRPGLLYSVSIWVVAVTLATLMAMASSLMDPPSGWLELVSRATVAVPWAVLFIAAVVFQISGASGPGARWRRPGQCLLVLAVVVDLAMLTANQPQPMRPELVFPSAPAYVFLGRQPGIFRTAVVDNASHPNYDMVYGLSSAQGYDFPLRRYADLLRRLGTSEMLAGDKIAGPNRRLLDLLNVRYVMATTENGGDRILAGLQGFVLAYEGGSIRIYENMFWLPRAMMIPEAETITSEQAIVERLLSPDFDATSTVLLEEPSPFDKPLSGNSSRPRGQASVLAIEPGAVRVHADSAEGGLLFLGDAFYPGWQAYVDGRPANILRADYVFRAVALGPGAHEVIFRYQPASVATGALISVLAMALTLGLVVLSFAGSHGSARTRPRSRPSGRSVPRSR